jgi:hypothetical protein
MTFFRDLDRAIDIRNQNAEGDPDWQYIVIQTQNETPTWVIEIRDEDGILIGCL